MNYDPPVNSPSLLYSVLPCRIITTTGPLSLISRKSYFITGSTGLIGLLAVAVVVAVVLSVLLIMGIVAEDVSALRDISLLSILVARLLAVVMVLIGAVTMLR